MGADLVLERIRSWTNLPMEILSFIAIRLPLIELLGFRGTCKDFRSASSTATAKIESTGKPWLLLQKSDSKCIIYNEHDSKTYSRHIPDLDGSTCLASFQGWLLLYKQEKIFFFSPFSLFKIPLPDFPHKEIDRQVGAFSHAPTSPNCIVSIIRIENLCFEVNMISKGEKTWTQHKIDGSGRVDLNPTLLGAIYDHKGETFYYMCGTSHVLTFSVKDKKGRPHRIVHGEPHKDTETLPYYYCENMFYDKKFEKNKVKGFEIEDDEYVDVCGLTYEQENGLPRLYLNEAINVSPTKTRVCKAVWIQPRFYEAHKDLHW